jgi:protein gp37
MGDIADFVKWNGFMDRLNDVMRECKQHTFLIITKRPDSLYGITFPDNVWIGVTVCESTQMGRINELHYTHCSQKSNYFISFEPLIQFINWKNWENIYQKPRWVIIGGLSIGSGRYISPNWFWIDDILDVVDDAGHPIPVYMKDNVDFVGIRKEIPISMPTYENER